MTLDDDDLTRLSDRPWRLRSRLFADELQFCTVFQNEKGEYLFEIPAEGSTGTAVGEGDREVASWILLAINKALPLVERVNDLEEVAKERDALVAEIDGHYRYTRYVTHAPKPLEGIQRLIESLEELKSEKAELESKVERLEDEIANLQEQSQ
jgi:hypothetical protein